MTRFLKPFRSLMAAAGLLLMAGGAHALSCPDNLQKDGALCYAKPRDGYTCTATLCVAACPDGYHSSGIGTCHYSGTLTYTQAPYLTRSHSRMQRCLAFFYNDCRAGYHMDVCGICSYKSAWDTTRASYDRGPGVNPDVSAAFRQVSITAQNTYGRALHGAEGVYKQSLQAFNDGLNEAIKQAALAASSKFVKANQATMNSMADKFAAAQTDADMINRIRRVVVAASKGIQDQATIDDMRVLADKLGATSLSTGWIFGVYGGFEAVAGAGVTSTVGIAVELKTLATQAPNVAGNVSGAIALGIDESVSVELGIFVSQGNVSTKTWSWSGPTLGISGTAAAGAAGLAVGVSYQLPTAWPSDPLALDDYFGAGQWGFSLAVGPGGGLGVALDVGTEFMFSLKKQ